MSLCKDVPEFVALEPLLAKMLPCIILKFVIVGWILSIIPRESFKHKDPTSRKLDCGQVHHTEGSRAHGYDFRMMVSLLIKGSGSGMSGPHLASTHSGHQLYQKN